MKVWEPEETELMKIWIDEHKDTQIHYERANKELKVLFPRYSESQIYYKWRRTRIRMGLSPTVIKRIGTTVTYAGVDGLPIDKGHPWNKRAEKEREALLPDQLTPEGIWAIMANAIIEHINNFSNKEIVAKYKNENDELKEENKALKEMMRTSVFFEEFYEKKIGMRSKREREILSKIKYETLL